MIEAANDNQPQTKLAEQLTALMALRNRPDSPPDPLQSSWSVEPSTVVIEADVEEDGEIAEKFAEDLLLLEITPSIRQIVREVASGQVSYGNTAPAMDGRPAPRHRQIVGIGKLRFSDGENHERAYKRGLDGDVVAYMRKMPAGAMLGTTEKLGGAHGSASPSTVTISNTNLSLRLTGRPSRPFTPGIRKRRTGRSYTAEESRALIDQAIANTPVLPSVTVCPPGVACGTAQASDQFIGMKIGSTGKGGAPNWVDFFMAGRDHEEWMETVAEVDSVHAEVLGRALTARTLSDVSPGGSDRGARKRGKRLLIAANDNLKLAMQKRAA